MMMFSTKLTLVALVVAVGFCTSGTGSELVYVACPGQNTVLTCPEGHKIQLKSMQSGHKDTIDCSIQTQPVEVSENCVHSMMLGWAQSICNNLQRCRLPKTSSHMFACESPSESFLQTTYLCMEQPPNMQSVTICDGETKDITCAQGRIEILNANYGRLDESTCTDTPSIYTFCVSGTAEDAIRARCDDKPECSLRADDPDLGTPYNCDTLPLYVSVDYICVE